MQICRFCGKLIPTETRYDPRELCICKTCEEEHRKQNEKVAAYVLEAMETEKRRMNAIKEARAFLESSDILDGHADTEKAKTIVKGLLDEIERIDGGGC